MHCLNTINRLNAEGYAVQKAKQLVSFNKHTVVEYHGVHAVEAHGFATYREASDFIDSLAAKKDSSNGKYHAPRNAAAYPERQAVAA
jgi:hypothetical protein